jgi:hypothetical protein
MDKLKITLIKIWLLAIGGAIVALLLLIFGTRFLIRPNDATDGQLFLLGIISGFAGIFTLAAQMYIPKKYMIGSSLILLAVYFFARATGVIEVDILMRIIGLASLLAASLMVYVTYLAENKLRS